MEFRILGPLDVLDAGRQLHLGGRRQRTLLAILILRANEPVSVDRLVDEMWGERPPVNAGKIVHVYVSRLRKALDGERPVSETPNRDPPGRDTLNFVRVAP